MKAKKLPSGNWRCQVYLGTKDEKKIIKSVTASTKKEAEYLAHQLLAEGTKENPSAQTVGEALDAYIAARENILSPSTLLEYRRARKRDYTSIENTLLPEMTQEAVQIFANCYAGTHSPKSTRNTCALLLSALRAADPTKNYRIAYPQKKPITYSLPDDDGIKKLLELADPDMEKAILMAASGTMRRGEICAVQYSDLAGNILHVHSDMIKGPEGWVIKEVPKNSTSDRYIPFSKAVIDKFGEGEGRIVPITPGRLSKRYADLREKAGLSCRFHDLRHYAASIMHAIGVPDQYIMERGGWSSDATLKAVYRNTLSDKQKEFSDKINGYLDGLIG